MKTATLLLFATAVLAGESGESPRAAGRNVYLKDDALGWQRVVRARDGRIVARDPADPPAALGLPPVVDGGLFQPYVATSVGSWPEAVAVGDLNGDLRNDVALVTSFYFDPVNDYCLFVFLQDSNGGLLPPVRYPIGQEPASVDIGDLNDDGRADVLVGRKDNGFSVLYQDAAGGLGAPVTYPTTQGLKVRIGDFVVELFGRHRGSCQDFL